MSIFQDTLVRFRSYHSHLPNKGNLQVTLSIKAIVAFLIIASASCGSERQTIRGSGKIEQIEIHSKWLSILGNSKANLSDLVNIDVFENFRPGSSIDTVISKHGEPAKRISIDAFSEYIEYKAEFGRVRLGYEMSGESNVDYPLYFYPYDQDPSVIFPPAVLEYVDLEAKEQVLHIYECGIAQPVIHATMNRGLIDKVVWIDYASLAHRSSPDQCTYQTPNTLTGKETNPRL